VLVRTDDMHRGVIGGLIGNDGRFADRVGTSGRLPPTAAEVADDAYRLRFSDGYDEAAREIWQRVGLCALGSSGVRAEDIASLVANQAARQRLADVAVGAGVAVDCAIDIISRTANAGSASFMLALEEAWSAAQARHGSVASSGPWLLASVGGGISYASLVVQP
jgi:3-oxoacyl-[acyl-carrier-protein] synthase III